MTHASNNSMPQDAPLNNEVQVLYTLMYVFSAVIVLPGIFGNGIILIAVLKLKHLRTHTNQLIASLAFADLLIVLSMITFVLMDKFPIKSIPREVTAFLFPSIDTMLGSASIWNLAAVSIDRGIAVMLPLRYKRLLGTRRVKVGIAVIWVYCILVFILAMLRIKFQSNEYNISLVFAAMIANFVLPCFIVVATYIGIFASAVKNVRVMRALDKVVQSASSRGATKSNVSYRKIVTTLPLEARLAFNVLIILVPLVAGWGFFFGTQWYEMMTGDYGRSNIYEFCMLVVPWINSSLNPVVYILATSSLRKACKQLLCGRRQYSKEGVFSTAIMSSFPSRRPSWLERRISISSSGEKTPKRKQSTDSRRGSNGSRKKSSATFVALDIHVEECLDATAQV